MNVSLVLPKQDLAKNPDFSQIFAVSYQVEKEKQEAFEQGLADYTENVNPQMGYISKDSLREEFSGMIGVIGTVGIALSQILMCFQYRYTVVPYVIMLAVFVAVAVIVPILAYRNTRKTSVVQRLRDAK